MEPDEAPDLLTMESELDGVERWVVGADSANPLPYPNTPDRRRVSDNHVFAMVSEIRRLRARIAELTNRIASIMHNPDVDGDSLAAALIREGMERERKTSDALRTEVERLRAALVECADMLKLARHSTLYGAETNAGHAYRIAVEALRSELAREREMGPGRRPEVERLRAESAWVPCSERMPEGHSLVLVTVTGLGQDDSLRFTGVAWVSAGKWIGGGSGRPIVHQTVVAWRPLPAPYQEDSNVAS